MPSTFFPSSVIVKKITLSDDNPHILFNADIPFYDCTIQCTTNDVVLGYAGIMDFALNVGDTYWLNNANLRDLAVKNRVAGNNGEIVLIATVPNKFVSDELGLTRGA